MAKYEERISGEDYENRLDNKIQEIGEILENDTTNPNYQQVVVEGSIFLVDRSAPRIVEYVGPADGVIITASINGLSNGWIKPSDVENITVTGKVKTYSGGTITNVTATKNGTTITGFSIDSDGKYTIDNITSDTTIVINAKDSNNKEATETIPVTIKVDTIVPTLSNAKAEVVQSGMIANEIPIKMKIKISVNATDDKSGIKQINYSVNPAKVNNASGTAASTGTIASGQVIELTATEETEYTVTFTAEDNAENTATATAGPVTTIESMTVAEVKAKVTSVNTLRKYIGAKVKYDSPQGGTWRVFYYDEGEFGKAGKVYLKRDYDSKLTKKLSDNKITNPNSNIINIMKRMNPLWRDTPANSSKIDLENEQSVAYLCDTSQWNQYRNTRYSSEAIGSPSVEMYMKAYNVWKAGSKTADNLICKIGNIGGYSVGANGNYNKSNEFTTGVDSIEVTLAENPEQYNLFLGGDVLWWLASPSRSNGSGATSSTGVMTVRGYEGKGFVYGMWACSNNYAICPVVTLDL